jgi:hypothetical protein
MGLEDGEKCMYRDISPAVAPAATTWSLEPSSLRRSPFADMHPVVVLWLEVELDQAS